jgi:hypothetical protein
MNIRTRIERNLTKNREVKRSIKEYGQRILQRRHKELPNVILKIYTK